MMDKERLRAEQDVLRQKLPENAYRFMDMDTAKPYLVLDEITNRGNIYTIRIYLDEFPQDDPKIYVRRGEMGKTKNSTIQEPQEPDTKDCIIAYKMNKVIIGGDEIYDAWVPIHFKVLFQLYEQTENSFIDIETRVHSLMGKVDLSWERWSPFTSLYKVYVLIKWWIEQTEHNQITN